jgi:hypothetical protein
MAVACALLDAPPFAEREAKSRPLASRANARDTNVAALTAVATPAMAAMAIRNDCLFSDILTEHSFIFELSAKPVRFDL